MTFVLVADIWQYIFGISLSLASLFLILLVLVQRGRGGGLSGAFGGAGGQSAFGTKAGDVFTRITIITATLWILLSLVAIKMLTPNDDFLGKAKPGEEKISTPEDTKTKPPKTTGAVTPEDAATPKDKDAATPEDKDAATPGGPGTNKPK